MLYFAEYSLLFAACLATLWLTGWCFEPLLLRRDDLGEERHLARFSIGSAAWIAGLFVLASCGGLHGWGLMSLGVLSAVVGIASRKSGGKPWKILPLSKPSGAAFLFGLLLLPLFALAMSPPVSWDAAVYHLTLPKHFIEHGGFRSLPFLAYAHWPLNIELLFAAVMLAKDYILAKLLHFGFGLLTLYALYLGARRPERSTGWLAAAFFVANPVVLFEMRVAYVDLALSFFFLTGFLFASRALSEPDRRSTYLILSAVSCGLMAGVKLSGIVGGVLIALFYLHGLSRTSVRSSWSDGLRSWAGRFALPVLVLWLPWLIKSWWLTGNPVYPLFHSILGGPDWCAGLSARFAAWQRSIGMGREAVDYLLLPLRVILKGGPGYQHFDGELGKHWLLLLPLALIVAWRSRAVRQPLAVAGAYFVFWAITSQQMRFLIPALALLALASARALDTAIGYLGAARLQRRLQIAVLTTILLVAGWQQRALLRSGLRTLVLYQSRDAAELRQSAVPPVYRFMNQQLPPGARVLLLNTNQGFFLDRPYLADSFFEASQIAAWLDGTSSAAALRQKWLSRGISHVLLDRHDRGIPFPPILWQTLDDPEAATELYRSADGRFVVLALGRSVR